MEYRLICLVSNAHTKNEKEGILQYLITRNPTYKLFGEHQPNGGYAIFCRGMIPEAEKMHLFNDAKLTSARLYIDSSPPTKATFIPQN